MYDRAVVFFFPNLCVCTNEDNTRAPLAIQCEIYLSSNDRTVRGSEKSRVDEGLDDIPPLTAKRGFLHSLACVCVC